VGAFVWAAANYRSSGHWGRRRWVVSLASCAIAGLCIFLTYYFGLSSVAHLSTGGVGLAFLLGTIGGLGGPSTFEWLKQKVEGLTRQDANQGPAQHNS